MGGMSNGNARTPAGPTEWVGESVPFVRIGAWVAAVAGRAPKKIPPVYHWKNPGDVSPLPVQSGKECLPDALCFWPRSLASFGEIPWGGPGAVQDLHL